MKNSQGVNSNNNNNNNNNNNFAVPADHRIKLKESEKKDKYLDLARELKTLWHMKVTIIPIKIGSFDTVTKGLLKGLEDLVAGGRVETIQIIILLKTARILWSPGDLLSLKLLWKTISKHWYEKLSEEEEEKEYGVNEKDRKNEEKKNEKKENKFR